MDTRIYTVTDLQKKSVQDDIKTTLQHGKNVVFPTETVYGIGASILSEEGIQNIYKIKGRPQDNPLIMHLSSTEFLEDYVYINQPYVTALMDAFWPGPLTLVFNKKKMVSDYFTGGLQTVGVRIPSSVVARTIIDIADVPLCAPSANISGKPSATLVEHVIEDFNHKVEIIIDGGKSEVGLESTVLDVTRPIPIVLRPGMVTVDMIEAITGEVHVSREIVDHQIPKSPGMKYKHYAPKGQMVVVDGDIEQVVAYINQETKKQWNKGLKTGVIATSEWKHRFTAPIVFEIGTADNDALIASNLFAALREMDTQGVEMIYSMAFHDGEFSEAIMNRLLKAANQQIVKL